MTQRDNHLERAFDTPDPVDLVVELGAGTLRAGADGGTGERSSVRVTGPRADEFTVDLRGGTLAVIAPKAAGLFRGGERHHVEVVVPAGSTLFTKTGSAATEATGRWQVVRAKTGSGDFDLEAADSHAVLDSGSGNVRCDEVGADLRVRSGSGSVEVGEVRGRATVSTGSGDVLLGKTLAPCTVKTGSGDIAVQRACADLDVTTGSGTLTITQARSGRVRGKTGSGDVRVGIATGTPVWTDVSTGSGRVASDLPPVGKPAPGQSHVELRLRTGSGDIALHQA